MPKIILNISKNDQIEVVGLTFLNALYIWSVGIVLYESKNEIPDAYARFSKYFGEISKVSGVLQLDCVDKLKSTLLNDLYAQSWTKICMMEPENYIYFTDKTVTAALNVIRSDFTALATAEPTSTITTSKPAKKKKAEISIDDELAKLRKSKSPVVAQFLDSELQIIKQQASLYPASSATLESDFSISGGLSEKKHSSMTSELLEGQMYVARSDVAVLKTHTVALFDKKNN